ncbi:MAG: LysM peptidoglycan-binding domain-containing protein [Deltaproteobacteria bacterium]|nr:LysM peptidoglycan-binding domain-containing protein [Deltaproteobacteria bacterium]
MATKTGYPVYYVQRGDNLWNIVSTAFSLTSNQAIANKMKEVTALNTHIKDPNRIRPGQVIYLGSGNGFQSDPVFGNDLENMEICLKEGSDSETCFLVNNFETLQVLSTQTEDLGDAGFLRNVNASPHSLAPELGAGFSIVQPSFLKVSKEVFGVVKKLAKTGKVAAEGRFGNLTKVSPHVWDKLHGELVRGIQKEVRYVKESSGALRLIPKNARAFSNGGKVIIVLPGSNGFSAFSHSTREARTLLRNLSRGANAVGVAIDFGVAGYNIQRDWGTPNQGRTVVRETVKTAAGMGAGLVSGSVATYVCGVLTFTTGWGGVACYLSVLVGTGVLTSLASRQLGEGAANLIYQSPQPKVIDGNTP